MNNAPIASFMLDTLRDKLKAGFESGEMSEKRYRHTLEVEKMAARLAKIFAPEKENILRAAALLHDVTKEYSASVQIALAEKYGIALTELDKCAPKTLHAMTAAASIPFDYPEFAFEEVISAVRWHTTGHEGMTLCEKLVYLADYIDMSRTFPDCVKLREYFFSKELEEMTLEEKLWHLELTLLMSYDMSIAALIEDNAPVSPDSLSARNEIAIKIYQKKLAEKKHKI